MTVRPDHRTVSRHEGYPPTALARVAGPCMNCEDPVEENSDIVLQGAAVSDGRVDLSDAEWVHMRCPTE